MQNTTKIPHFSFVTNAAHHDHYKCIVAGDDVIEKMNSLDEFYKVFGYTIELAKAGIGADEFMWDHYLKDARLSACVQMHVIEYLNKHSARFNALYGGHYEEHVKDHALTREARGFACFACKHESFCEN
jgi:hypothetical protein